MIQSVKLKSEVVYKGSIPPSPIGFLLRELPIVVIGAVRMAFQGRSVSFGRNPRWLNSAADIRLVDISSKRDTVIRFDVPRIGMAAEELYRQTELLDTRPDEQDTALDLLGDILLDLANEETDSNKFDLPLLKNLYSFHNVINGCFQELIICGHRYPASKPAILDEKIIGTAHDFYAVTPMPVRTRVVGSLDMIQESTRGFVLKLDNEEEARGISLTGEMKQLANMFGQRVLVTGEAIFRSSGRLLRIDAESITAAEEESSVWSKMPLPMDKKYLNQTLHQPQGKKSGLAAIIGRWPGEESDDDIEEVLKEVS